MNILKSALSILFITASIAAYPQDALKTHVVAKGETVDIICTKYGVSKDELIKENPTLKNYIYVGMKIRIPSSASTITTSAIKNDNVQQTPPKDTSVDNKPVEPSSTIAIASPPMSQNSPESSAAQIEVNKNENRWMFADKIGYYMSPDNKGGFSMCFSIGAGYILTKHLVLEGLIGYGYGNYSAKISGYETESQTHHLVMNQNIHLILPIGSFFGIGAYMGPEEQMFLTGTTTVNKEKNKMNPSKRLSVSYDIGARVYLGGFFVGAEYKIGLTKDAGALWGISIGYLVNM